MIKVDSIDAGLFQVIFTDDDLDRLVDVCLVKNVSPDDLLRGLLMFAFEVYGVALFSERSPDELAREDEGMGRG